MEISKAHDELRLELEQLSRDMLLLVRTVGIYPEGHPQLAQMVGRITEWARKNAADGLTLGITGSEMVVLNQFFGGSDSRIEIFSKRLNRRRLARLTLVNTLCEEEVYAFARVLADTDLYGDDIVNALEAEKVKSITVIALDLDALHSRLQLGVDDKSFMDSDRSKKLWQWLQEVAGNPREVGKTLATEEFWADALSDDSEIRAEFIDMLVGLGSMLDRAMESVPEETRDVIGRRLTALGNNLPSDELAELAAVYMEEESPNDFAVDALMEQVKGEKLAEVLGNLAAMGGNRDERVAAFIKKFVPTDAVLGLVGLVREWKSGGMESLSQSAEIWEWLESFLLDIDEDEFMGKGYRATLDRMVERMRIEADNNTAFGFFEDPEAHLDRVCAGLAMDSVEDADTILAARVEQRLRELEGAGAVNLIASVDAIVPDALQGNAKVYEYLFGPTLTGVKDFSDSTRSMVVEFAKHHESQALEAMCRALATEEKISVRRFLVEVLGQLSKATVPQLVQSARNAPWYYVRNIAIVLGLLGDRRAVPFLISLLAGDNPKIRKEVVRSLARLGGEGSQKALIAFAMRPSTPSSEAKLAQAAANKLEAK